MAEALPIAQGSEELDVRQQASPMCEQQLERGLSGQGAACLFEPGGQRCVQIEVSGLREACRTQRDEGFAD